MCGICGFKGSYPQSLLEAMTQTMHHRGPDETGFFYQEGIGLGHTRLSIVDLDTGRQPLFNEEGSVTLVFNGEIYNYKEMRERLMKRGHRFSTKTDSEVIVHAYEEYGESCLEDLNGMFAFAVWDSIQQKVFLARDRLGIKPLYYTIVNGKLLFASELKALLQCEEVNQTLHFGAIDDFLTFRYVPGGSTFFAEIQKLPPGHFLTFQHGRKRIQQYWRLHFKEERQKSAEAFAEEFHALLQDSVRLQLMGDVPVGAFLSGGLDSSVVVALMAEANHVPRKTFSVGFGMPQDEVGEARRIASLFGTEHYEVGVTPEDLFSLPKIVWHLEDPIGDSIIVPSYLLSQLARRHVKVVLTGEGADELLGGYVHQEALLTVDRIPPFLGDVLGHMVRGTPVSLLDHFFQYPASLGKEGRRRLSLFLRRLGNRKENYLYFVSLFTVEDKKELYTEKFRALLPGGREEEDLFAGLKETTDFTNWLLKQELSFWLPDDILFKQDKLTMANSVEGRVPYLDHRIVEFLGRVPSRLKIHKGMNKILLRRAFRNILPSETVTRKKQAFFMPLEGKFQKTFRELCNVYLSPERVKRRGLLNPGFIAAIFKKSARSPLLCHKQLMALLILEIWFDVFIEHQARGEEKVRLHEGVV
ncbi:MAG: asparagine synthase (glutamine-hydrolyzing) [Candidatus Omnitrophica bacterium]|nr:asparagine synthase (glutamine-hydrolyzing) [Candidatus Omnitrophota bacterium]